MTDSASAENPSDERVLHLCEQEGHGETEGACPEKAKWRVVGADEGQEHFVCTPHKEDCAEWYGKETVLKRTRAKKFCQIVTTEEAGEQEEDTSTPASTSTSETPKYESSEPASSPPENSATLRGFASVLFEQRKVKQELEEARAELSMLTEERGKAKKKVESLQAKLEDLVDRDSVDQSGDLPFMTAESKRQAEKLEEEDHERFREEMQSDMDQAAGLAPETCPHCEAGNPIALLTVEEDFLGEEPKRYSYFHRVGEATVRCRAIPKTTAPWEVEHLSADLRKAWPDPDFEVKESEDEERQPDEETSTGDENVNQPIAEAGSASVFCQRCGKATKAASSGICPDCVQKGYVDRNGTKLAGEAEADAFDAILATHGREPVRAAMSDLGLIREEPPLTEEDLRGLEEELTGAELLG